MSGAQGSGIRLTVLGMFELVVHGDPVELPLQARRVLAYLAVVQPRLPRSVLAGTLWGGVPQRRATATLRNALWRLRRISESLVRATRDTVGIGPQVWIDLAYIRRCAAALDARQPLEREALRIDMLDSDLLLGWEEEWLPLERERQRQMRLHALESMAEAYARQGRHAEAIQAALAAIRVEPLRETAQATLIRIHLSEGNAVEAVRQFESFRRLLADELGLRPSGRIESLLSEADRRPDAAVRLLAPGVVRKPPTLRAGHGAGRHPGGRSNGF